MRRALPVFTAACLLGAFAAPAADAEPAAGNADICASTDNATYPPERRISACGALIETLTDQPAALAVALVHRAATYRRIKANDRALTDLDHAIADYQQALNINPQFDKAAENLADARQERDRRTAASSDALLPSFNCAAASRAAEKAICSDPDLARLDRAIDGAYRAALAGRSGKAALAELRQEQRDFIAARNRSFGNPGYNLKHEMELRLAALKGESARVKP